MLRKFTMAKKNYPKEIRQAALPIFLSNSVFGIGIIEYPVGRPHYILSYFYIAIILVLYTLSAIYSYPYLKELGPRMMANQVIMKVFFGSHVFLAISSVLIGCNRNQGLHIIVQQVVVADESLLKLGIDPNYRKVFKSQFWKTILFILIICIAATIINLTFLYGESMTIDKIMFLVVIDFPIIVLSIGDSSFLNIIQYATFKLKELNTLLKKKLTSTLDHPQHTNLLKYNEIPTNSQQNSREPMKNDLYTISMARLGHSNFRHFCKITNKVFAFHILISMFVAMIMLTGCLYHTYALLTAKNIKIRHHYVFGILSAIFIYNTLRICLFAKYCCELAGESIKTGDIIGKMYDENISEECQIEIRHFEAHLIELPLRIQIGYITIDYTFVEQMISTIATNLVILTQVGNVSIEVPEK